MLCVGGLVSVKLSQGGAASKSGGPPINSHRRRVAD